jgi:hypothetical protein
MKTKPTINKGVKTVPAIQSENVKKTIMEELMEELNNEEDDFILDGVHFKLSPLKTTSEIQAATAGANINQLSKQINDLHKLSFSDTKDLSKLCISRTVSSCPFSRF